MKQLERLEARALILDLFVTRRGAVHDLAALCHAGHAFGLSAGAVRTALARLKREGRIVNLGRGRYAPAPGRDAIRGRIVSWRRRLHLRRPWSGAWLIAATGPQARANRTVWRRIQRALLLEGFCRIEADLHARPDNLPGGAAGARNRLQDLGVPPALLVGSLRDVEPERAQGWMAFWRSNRRHAEHRRLVLRLRASTRRLAGRADAAAAAESLLLGREAVRAILQDPLLPEEIASSATLHDLVSAMAKYDSLGKSVWRRYLALSRQGKSA